MCVFLSNSLVEFEQIEIVWRTLLAQSVVK